jgi:hypothetical protein
MFEKHGNPPNYDDVSRGAIEQAAEFLPEKLSDSLRYGLIQTETHSSHDSDHLQDELKGKRMWKVGGVGMWAYQKDDRNEEKKKDVWRNWGEKHGKDEWIKAARARTNWYNDGQLIGDTSNLLYVSDPQVQARPSL